MLELKETNHNYYCSESNYYHNGSLCEYDTWEDFKSDWFINETKIDSDYNLCFRYDILQSRDSETDDLIECIFELWLFFILQRKGNYTPVCIKKLEESDIEEVNTFLKQVWEYHKFQWNEIQC